MKKKHIFTIFLIITLLNTVIINSCWDWFCCCWCWCYDQKEKEQKQKPAATMQQQPAVASTFNAPPDFDQNPNEYNNKKDIEPCQNQYKPSMHGDESFYQGKNYGSFDYSSDDGFAPRRNKINHTHNP